MSATPANPRPSSDYGLASLASPLNPQLDVVFVHGLNGSRCETWTNANNEIWLSWLGDMVPAARIWTYGYNSAAWRKPSKDALVMHCNAFLECCREKGIGNHDRVKVVLIGHSLGGILIKLSLIQASKVPGTSNWAPLLDCVISVVFLGTPHRGSEWANRLYFTQLGMSLLRRRSSWVALLRKRNEELSTVAEAFNSIWSADKPVLTFRETKGPPIIGRIMGTIVKPEDAMTHCLGETVVDTPYDHTRIVRPLTKEEIVPKRIAEHLRGLISMNETPSVLPKSSPNTATMLRKFYLYLQKELEDERYGWQKDDVEFSADLAPNANADQKASKFCSGSFSFVFPEHKTTTVTLNFPSRRSYVEAQWMINSVDSPYHPGRHTGRLVFPLDFPASRPHIVWDSPILSAFVEKGGLCVDYPWGRPPFYDILRSLAAVVIFGPELEITTDPTVPKPKFSPHKDNSPILLKCEFAEADRDWIMRVTNFFSRAYNRTNTEGEVDISREITELQRETACQAIKDCQNHFDQGNEVKEPKVFFKTIVTQGELQKEERKWADELNGASMVTQGWGRAETFEDHFQRLGRSHL